MISIKNKNILLIGGAGFIGHHLALKLKDKGANVFIVDGMNVNNVLHFTSTGKNEIDNRKLYLYILNQRIDIIQKNDIPLYVEDARNYHSISSFIDKLKIDIVFHLAAVSHAAQSNKTPYTTFDHSFRTLENALDSSRERVEHFVYFSSSMIYGNFEKEFVTEETPCEPIGIYGALKFGGEKLVIAYNQVFDLPYTIIRPSALYGERCVSRRVGQIFIENAIQGKKISISGNGKDRLDFTYIEDLVQGLIKCIESEKAKNQILNLTYGESRSINDILEILKQHFPNIECSYLPKDKLMPERGTLSIDKAKRLIGYKPEYPIEKGFVKYIKWYEKFYSYYEKTIKLSNDFKDTPTHME